MAWKDSLHKNMKYLDASVNLPSLTNNVLMHDGRDMPKFRSLEDLHTFSYSKSHLDKLSDFEFPCLPRSTV